MNRGLMAGAAILGVVGAGVGGYFFIDHQVRTTVHDIFETATQDYPLITQASYETLDVDLMGDRLTLKNTTLSFDLSALEAQVHEIQPNMSIRGTAEQSYESIVISGIWGLVLGDDNIRQIDLDNTTFYGTVVQTIDMPNTDQPSKTRITTTFDGGTATAMIRGMTMSSMEGSVLFPLSVTIDDYLLKDTKVSIAIKPKSEKNPALALNATDLAPLKAIPSLHADFSVAQVIAKELSPTYLGLLRYEDIAISILPREPEKDPIMMKVGAISLSDTAMDDLTILRTTMDLSDMVIDTSKMDDPKAKAVMTMLGVDQININMKYGFQFDPDKQTLSIDPFRFGLKQVGSVDFSFALQGVPDMKVFNQIQQLQGDQEKINAAVEDAFQDLALNHLAVGYTDEGVLKKFIAAQALQAKIDPDQLAQAYARQGGMMIEAAFGKEEALKAQETIETFLMNPDALRIQFQAKTPVKIKALVDDFKASGPTALRAFQLNITGGAKAIMN